MSRYIDADDAITAIRGIPAAEIEVVQHGKWITMETSHEWLEDFCSVCRHAKGVILDFPYCPYCGAKMDGGE